MRRVVLFAGPTLARARAMGVALPEGGVEVAPPVARGMIPRLVATRPPGVLVLVDGVFHQRLAVGHAELRDALARGWAVWGLSSMGAIRAREMRDLGVRGFGEVYARFERTDRDVRDDEVALLHGPAPDYREASEPLVHLEAALDDLARRGVLAAADAKAIYDELDGAYFGDRTLPRFAALVRARAPEVDPLEGFDRHRLKCHDLARFCAEVLPGLVR